MSTGLITRLLVALLLLTAPAAHAQTKPATPAGPALKTYQGEYEGGRATYTYYQRRRCQRPLPKTTGVAKRVHSRLWVGFMG